MIKKNSSKKYGSRVEKNNNRRFYYNNKSLNDKNTKKTIIIIILLVCSIFCNFIFIVKINDLDVFNDNMKKQYTDKIESLKMGYTNYLFLGDSITDFYDLDKYYDNFPVVNSGVSGNTTDDILNDMKNRVYSYNPSKVFLLIGTNDLIYDKSIDDIVSNIKKIIEEIKENKPQVEIYLESIYPVNKKINKDMVAARNNKDIKKINKKLNEYCENGNCTYIDIYNILIDGENFSQEYTDDGLHPNDKGYEVITRELKKYLD